MYLRLCNAENKLTGGDDLISWWALFLYLLGSKGVLSAISNVRVVGSYVAWKNNEK